MCAISMTISIHASHSRTDKNMCNKNMCNMTKFYLQHDLFNKLIYVCNMTHSYVSTKHITGSSKVGAA